MLSKAKKYDKRQAAFGKERIYNAIFVRFWFSGREFHMNYKNRQIYS